MIDRAQLGREFARLPYVWRAEEPGVRPAGSGLVSETILQTGRTLLHQPVNPKVVDRLLKTKELAVDEKNRLVAPVGIEDNGRARVVGVVLTTSRFSPSQPGEQEGAFRFFVGDNLNRLVIAESPHTALHLASRDLQEKPENLNRSVYVGVAAEYRLPANLISEVSSRFPIQEVTVYERDQKHRDSLTRAVITIADRLGLGIKPEAISTVPPRIEPTARGNLNREPEF